MEGGGTYEAGGYDADLSLDTGVGGINAQYVVLTAADSWWDGGTVAYTGLGQVQFEIVSSIDYSDDFTWKEDRSGDWNLGENWSPSDGPPGSPTAPKRANHKATFGEVIQSNRAVFSESDVSVRAIVFDNTNTYTVGGPGSVSLVQGTDVGLPANSIINVANGTHEFQLRVELQNNTTGDIASGSTLEFNNRLFLNGHTLTNKT